MTIHIELQFESTPPSPVPRTYTDNKRRHEQPDVESQLNKIVSILGWALGKVKEEIMEKKESHVPSPAVTFLLRRMNVQEEEVYCLMTGFMTVYLCFIENVLQQDFQHFIQLFSQHDSLLNLENQPFLWFYALHCSQDTMEILKQISVNIDQAFILKHIDSIFSKFYTLYFLEAAAQKHQKDHGQYYTPQSVIQFMWDKCASMPTLVQYLQRDQMPRVFDPCLGMGSFLCEFLTRFIKACRFSIVWNDPDRLKSLITQDIPNHVWGIELDPFAYQLCKINTMVQLFPLYERLKELGVKLEPASIQRLRLFCNDSLKMRVDTNPFWDTNTSQVDLFEQNCLDLLRDASQLKFDYIVTNPPYMIRKTGFITQPDPAIYDETKLGGRGSQAYLYFMWIALQRCDDQKGQVCLITPSQWTVLEFAQHLREWIWDNCKLLDMYEFEPYKVWPKVQTDSLIFRVCKRNTTLLGTDFTLYLRHTSRKISLHELLHVYNHFDITQGLDNDLKCKQTFLNESNRILTSKHASFAFILPNASCLEELNSITQHLPRLCDGEIYRPESTSQDVPLVWNRGPNTNPVYSLVVRTSWAIKTFGVATYIRWLRPCFYWNGKTISSTTAGGKEGEFWRTRDPLRLAKKENSAAEAYWPYCNIDPENPTLPFYSLITVNKEDADTLKLDHDKHGAKSESAALYYYLKEARIALQPDKTTAELAFCQYNKCGTNVPVKIVHPINCGYFTRSQPRSRFFVDTSKMAVTNQCIYFTIKPNYQWQDANYFCGLLNSTLIQFFIKIHCCYDQQGRMRFFGRLMAYIPFAPPPSIEFMQHISMFVQGITVTRNWLYTFIRHLDQGQQFMERIRNCEWRLTSNEIELLHHFKPPNDWRPQTDTNLAILSNDYANLQWIHTFVTQSYQAGNKNIEQIIVPLLKIASLFQLVVNQMVYHLYKIPERLQLEVEQDLNLTSLRKEWEFRNDLELDHQNINDSVNRVFHIAKSFTNI